jgi:hypothetical protein
MTSVLKFTSDKLSEPLTSLKLIGISDEVLKET